VLILGADLCTGCRAPVRTDNTHYCKMSPSESLAAAYAVVFLVAGAWLLPRRKRARQTVGLAVAGLAVAVSGSSVERMGGEVLRAWWLLPFLPLAYWMPAPLVSRAHEGLEAWLLAVDRKLGLGPVIPALPLELSYLTVYPMVPAGLLAVLGAGGVTADQYWLGVLMAVLPCYGLLPLAATRPPRALFRPTLDATVGAVRHVNVRFLSVFGNQWNTLPSGHAAGAIAVAILVWTAGSPFAPLVVVLALGICTATVSGRYHYVIDTVSGMGLGALAGWLAS
jgi:hypothetical protein